MVIWVRTLHSHTCHRTHAKLPLSSRVPRVSGTVYGSHVQIMKPTGLKKKQHTWTGNMCILSKYRWGADNFAHHHMRWTNNAIKELLQLPSKLPLQKTYYANMWLDVYFIQYMRVFYIDTGHTFLMSVPLVVWHKIQVMRHYMPSSKFSYSVLGIFPSKKPWVFPMRKLMKFLLSSLT